MAGVPWLNWRGRCGPGPGDAPERLLLGGGGVLVVGPTRNGNFNGIMVLALALIGDIFVGGDDLITMHRWRRWAFGECWQWQIGFGQSFQNRHCRRRMQW
jgi:hypothetical protein